MTEDVAAAADGGDFLDGEKDAGFVVSPHDGNDGGVGANLFLQEMEVDGAVGFDGHEGDGVALFLEELAVVEGGGMFNGGGDDVALVGLSDDGAVDGSIVALGAAACENDFAWIGVNQFGELETGLVEMARDSVAEAIGAGRIAPLFAEKGQHRFDDFGGDSSRGVVVEVTDFAIHSGA